MYINPEILKGREKEAIKGLLDAKVALYNQPEFIEHDPVLIPHQFSTKQDREIMGLFAAVLAWGQRKTIINKCFELIDRMDGAPFDFIRHHTERELKALLGFKHRTFNDTDLLYFVFFLQQHYLQSDSLETAFTGKLPVAFAPDIQVEKALNHFKTYFFSFNEAPQRTKKHISAPAQKSTCKRLNMFLRWMVRKDEKGVDFGIWHQLSQAALICPCDVHVERVARKLGLITRPSVDWQTALELTNNLRDFDPLDPVKYDFALFGLGIEEKFGY